MATMELRIHQGIHILTLTNADNQCDNMLTTSVLEEYLTALDTVENHHQQTALVITSDHDKTFCTGINLEWLRSQTDTEQRCFVDTLNRVLCRIALLNAPTIAAINGNAYAGGAIIATATDYRIMREDRGRFCFPEVNINIPFNPVTRDVVHLLGDEQLIKQMVLTGEAYTGTQCLEKGIVRSIHPADKLQDAAIELGTMLANKDRDTYCRIRNSFRPLMTAHADQLGISYVGQSDRETVL